MLTLLKFSDYPLYWYLKSYYAEDRIMPIEILIFYFLLYFAFGGYTPFKKIKPNKYTYDTFDEVVFGFFRIMSAFNILWALMHLVHFHFFYN